jgi:hypothetical protein
MIYLTTSISDVLDGIIEDRAIADGTVASEPDPGEWDRLFPSTAQRAVLAAKLHSARMQCQAILEAGERPSFRRLHDELLDMVTAP